MRRKLNIAKTRGAGKIKVLGWPLFFLPSANYRFDYVVVSSEAHPFITAPLVLLALLRVPSL